jgi:uncharacterized protein
VKWLFSSVVTIVPLVASASELLPARLYRQATDRREMALLKKLLHNLSDKREGDLATRRQQRLVLGPWDHGTIGKSKVAEVDFGAEAALDVAAIQLDWFDRHLKQDAAAQAKPFPPVKYFSMGDNVWRECQTWPPEDVVATSFFLHSDGQANTRKGNGRLSRKAPTQEQPADSFKADPANPTPSSPVTETRPLKAAVWGPVDQRATEDRDDVLV